MIINTMIMMTAARINLQFYVFHYQDSYIPEIVPADGFD